MPERAVIGAVRVGDPEIPDEFPGSGDAGFWIEAGNGVFSGNDARRNLSIPNNAIGTTIYAPTHMPAGNACIETVTAHWRFTGMGETAHGHGFWDHCIEGGWDTFEFMDSSWVDTYIRLENGVERYWTEVYESNGCWYGLLYNWDLEQWEHKVSPAVCDSSEFADGWTMWESHYLMDQAQVCPSFPPIRAADVSIWDGSSWNHLSTSDSSDLGPYGLCWQNETYTLQVHSANHDWEAYTPDP